MTEVAAEKVKQVRINIQKKLEAQIDRLKKSVPAWDKGEAIMRALYFVEAGAITQEQANTMVDNAEARALANVVPLSEDEAETIKAECTGIVQEFFSLEKKDKERYSLKENLFNLYSEDAGPDAIFKEVQFYAEKKAREDYRKELHSKK